MPLTIPDDVLRQAGLTEREARIEFACRLFDAGKIALRAAIQIADLTRSEMEDALLDRGIAIYRPTMDDLRQDIENLRRAGV
jgi:predicted HTH domain antitoxin